jgi:hypothetical protein
MTLVRVTCTQKVELVEYIDIEVNKPEGSVYGAPTLAESVIKAQVAAGVPLQWVRQSEEPASYPEPWYEAREIEVPLTTKEYEDDELDI